MLGHTALLEFYNQVCLLIEDPEHPEELVEKIKEASNKVVRDTQAELDEMAAYYKQREEIENTISL